MRGWRLAAMGPLALAALTCPDVAEALIAGRDAETNAADLEKQGKPREAAVWRLVAARGFRELIIPFEFENVRAFSAAGKQDLAQICAQRAEVLYPGNVRKNLRLYEEDLQKAGGEPLRAEAEREAVELLAKFAPIPTAVPCRLSHTEEKEKAGQWLEAADYREVAARVYLLITVPFFERESDRAKDEPARRRWQEQALASLKLARESFLLAAEDYQRAARAANLSADRLQFCLRKAAEMQEQADALAFLIAAGERRR